MSLPLLGSGPGSGTGSSGPTPGANATAFLARTTGLDTTHRDAYINLINGLDTDGLFTRIDVLHVYATQDSTTALLNLISTSFNGTANGSPTFTADRGYTGTEGSSTVYINTGFNPTVGTPQYTRNSAHISVWNLSASSSSRGLGNNGSNGSADASYILTGFSGDQVFRVNTASVTGSDLTTVASPIGQYVASRNSSSEVKGYKAGSLVLTNSSATSSALVNLNMYTLGFNFNGTAVGSNNQMAAISFGASLDATQAANLTTRLRTFGTAVGVP